MGRGRPRLPANEIHSCELRIRITEVEEFLYDPKNGDFDTIKISFVVNPDGSRENVYKYFKETGLDFVEISKEEYEERYSVYQERLLSNEEEKTNRNGFYAPVYKCKTE